MAAASVAWAGQPSTGGGDSGAPKLKAGDVYTNPEWRKRPTADDMRVVWPAKAWERGKGGRALITCSISVQGTLYGCKVVSEDPPGEGFGQAAIALTPQMLMKPAMLNGKPVGGATVSLPIKFEMPAGFEGNDSRAAGPGMARAAMAWTRAPTAAEVAAAYPEKARNSKQAGFVSLACELNKEGGLRSCSTMTEEPKGLGLAPAARELSKLFRAPTTTSDGKSVNGIAVHLPIAFDPEVLAGEAVVGKPVWAGLPDAAAFQAAFGGLPPEVSEVQVTLACTVEQGGAVSGCSVARETPAGLGIGERALPLAKGVKLATWSAEGLPTVGRTVRIPFKFQLKDATEVAAQPAK